MLPSASYIGEYHKEKHEPLQSPSEFVGSNTEGSNKSTKWHTVQCHRKGLEHKVKLWNIELQNSSHSVYLVSVIDEFGSLDSNPK